LRGREKELPLSYLDKRKSKPETVAGVKSRSRGLGELGKGGGGDI